MFFHLFGNDLFQRVTGKEIGDAKMFTIDCFVCYPPAVKRATRASGPDNFCSLCHPRCRRYVYYSHLDYGCMWRVANDTLFEKPTIEGLAIAVRGKQDETIDWGDVSSILAGIESLSEEEIERKLKNGTK